MVGGDTVIDLCSSEDDSDSEVDVIEEDNEVVVLDAHDYVVEPGRQFNRKHFGLKNHYRANTRSMIYKGHREILDINVPQSSL